MSAPVSGEPDELLQAQGFIRNHLFKFIDSMSLKCAVELGIPDIIHNHGKPMTLLDLVDALKINTTKAPSLYRLMRLLTHSGFFFETGVSGSYILAPPSKLILKDDPLSLRPYLLAMLDPVMTGPWHNLSYWFQSNDVNPFATTHGKQLYQLAGQEQRLNHIFNQAMASDARLVSTLILENYKEMFEGLNSLVDVGGGTGTLAKVISDAYPHLKCTVLDLPHVIQGLEEEDTSTKNLTYVGGDMFDCIPHADAIFLKSILHDWSDEDSVKILKKCREAIPDKERGGKVIIVDMVLGDDDDDINEENKLFFDMLMMAVTNGRGRNEKEWAKLFSLSGFSDYRITYNILGWRSLLETYYYY